MPAIEVNEVSKYYKKFLHRHKFLTFKSAMVNRTIFQDLRADERFEALRGVSFNVDQGKTLGIIGENGSGKSTLLKILAGISRPTSGQVKANGRLSALIELGAGFHPEISGRENIFINGIILGLTRKQIQERYQSIVRFAELEDFIENPVKTYSSGMYMRLGFSIAINVDPDILLIDEVLSVGDASFVPKCLDRINEFRRLGKTIVFVSHDLNTVERICDEVIWLRNGVIQMRGYPKRTVDAYLEYIGKKDLEATRQKHEDESQAAASGREQRWGGKEIEISNVRMYSTAGEEKYVFQAGESATVAFDVLARQPESDFVFGLAIYGGAGVLCYGSNTQIEEFRPETIAGSGRVRITIPALNLGNGTYFLDLAAHKRDGYPFDYHHFLYSFRVNSLSRELGMLRLPHTWEFSENIRWKRQ